MTADYDPAFTGPDSLQTNYLPEYTWNYLATTGALFSKPIKTHAKFSDVGDSQTVYSFSSYRQNEFNFKSSLRLQGDSRALSNQAFAMGVALVSAVTGTALFF